MGNTCQLSKADQKTKKRLDDKFLWIRNAFRSVHTMEDLDIFNVELYAALLGEDK